MIKILDAPDSDAPSRTIVGVGGAGPGGFGGGRSLTDAERLRNVERRVDRLDDRLDQILKSLKQSKTPER